MKIGGFNQARTELWSLKTYIARIIVKLIIRLELAKLQQSKTDSELKESIDLLEKENQLLRVKLDKIKGGENLVDLDEKRKVRLGQLIWILIQ